MTLYLAGREMFDRRTGIIAALLAATSSVFWFQGEIAAPYTTDLLASALVGWLCYHLLTRPGRKIIWATAFRRSRERSAPKEGSGAGESHTAITFSRG